MYKVTERTHSGASISVEACLTVKSVGFLRPQQHPTLSISIYFNFFEDKYCAFFWSFFILGMFSMYSTAAQAGINEILGHS